MLIFVCVRLEGYSINYIVFCLFTCSLLAVLVKLTADQIEDERFAKFCSSVRRLCRRLIQQQVLDRSAQVGEDSIGILCSDMGRIHDRR